MPYEVENQTPGSQFAGALAGALTGFQQGRAQRDEERRAAKEADLQNQLTQQQIAAGTASAEQQQRVQAFQAKLQLPKDWNKMSADDKQSYLQQRINKANAVGDQTTVDNAQAMINSLQYQQQRESQAQLNLAKVGLTNAQANNVRNSFQDKMAEIAARNKGQVDVAKIRAAYARLGGGRAGNTAAAEQRIEMQAIAAGMRQNSQAYNEAALATYRLQEQYHLADPTKYAAPDPLPVQNQVYVPQVGANGQITVIPVAVPQAPQTSQQTPQVNTTTPQATTQTGGGGWDWGKIGGNVLHGIGNVLMPHNANTQPTKLIGNKTYYQRADGKWYPTP